MGCGWNANGELNVAYVVGEDWLLLCWWNVGGRCNVGGGWNVGVRLMHGYNGPSRVIGIKFGP